MVDDRPEPRYVNNTYASYRPGGFGEPLVLFIRGCTFRDAVRPLEDRMQYWGTLVKPDSEGFVPFHPELGNPDNGELVDHVVESELSPIQAGILIKD